MSTKFKRIVGIYPSTSGNVRVAIEFHDRGDMNFYMTKDGDLHIGKTHDEHTLDNPLEAYQEFKWAQQRWRQGNPGVVTEDLTGEKRQMAIALCIILQDQIERKKAFQKAMAARRSTSTMKANPELNKTLKDIKKNIQKGNKDKGNQQKPVQQTTSKNVVRPANNEPAKQATPGNIQQPNGGTTDQPVINNGEEKPNYGKCRIEQFNNKYKKPA